jgi:hypothetical protein
MNPLRVSFSELYRRHLCRHSQYGINVQHLAGVAITYLCLYALLRAASGAWWPLGILSALYLAVLLLNIPTRLWVLTAAFVGALLGAIAVLPGVPWWAYVITLVAAYKVQVWTHRYWDHGRGMTDFDERYKKGVGLFVLLSVYELPILLNYVAFEGDTGVASPLVPRATNAQCPAEALAASERLA